MDWFLYDDASVMKGLSIMMGATQIIRIMWQANFSQLITIVDRGKKIVDYHQRRIQNPIKHLSCSFLRK